MTTQFKVDIPCFRNTETVDQTKTYARFVVFVIRTCASCPSDACIRNSVVDAVFIVSAEQVAQVYHYITVSVEHTPLSLVYSVFYHFAYVTLVSAVRIALCLVTTDTQT